MRGELPKWADYVLLPAINLAVAFIVAGMVVLLIGENPFEAAYLLLRGAFGYGGGIAYTLYYATNFIFTGLSVAIAFHCGLFNIGSEGQAYIGGLAVAIACLALDHTMPWWIIFPLAILGSALFGAAWAFIPAWLQAKRGSHIVITTIMFNFIASSVMVWLLVDFLKPAEAQGPQTRTFLEAGQIPKLDWLFELFGSNLGGAPLNLSFFLSLICAFLVWVLIWRTRFGYELRTTGTNPTAAIYAGIPKTRTIVVTMLISGGLAGMMALNPVMGDQARMELDFPAQAGFVGIAVALMGRSHPVGIVFAAILFGMLYQGGAELSFDMPNISRDMIVVIQGLVILFAGALEHMFRPSLIRLFDTVSSGKSAAEGAS